VVWVTILKTTIEISDPLLRKAKALARRRGTTLRELVESGLRRVLEDERPQQFRLEDRSVPGAGLADGLDYGEWAKILERAYEDRG
jgi:hypothetical protein